MPERPEHSIIERLPKFHEMAADAKRAASEASNPELRKAYEDLARSWEQLISEILARAN
jgi:Ribonuclease G/E